MKEITSELIEKYTSKFNGRYLTMQTFKKLKRRERQFHFDGHWNLLHLVDDSLCHSYMNGATGEIEHRISNIDVSEIDKTVFVKHRNTFILFKRNKGILKPIYVNNEVRRIEPIKPHHLFLNENGVKVIRKSWELNTQGFLTWVFNDAFTGEIIKQLNQ